MNFLAYFTERMRFHSAVDLTIVTNLSQSVLRFVILIPDDGHAGKSASC